MEHQIRMNGILRIFSIEDCKREIANGKCDKITYLIWYIDMNPPKEFIDLYPNLKKFGCVGEIKSLEGLSGSQLVHIDLMLSNIESLFGIPGTTRSVILPRSLKSLKGIENCPELNFLNMPGKSIIDDLSYLSSCTKLETLYVPYTKIKDISCLRELVNLKNLACPNYTIIPQEIRDLPGIKINQSTGISTM